jgi:hypothetical protein
MLIAILSDTHDNAASTRAALALLAPHQPAERTVALLDLAADALRFLVVQPPAH